MLPRSSLNKLAHLNATRGRRRHLVPTAAPHLNIMLSEAHASGRGWDGGGEESSSVQSDTAPYEVTHVCKCVWNCRGKKEETASASVIKVLADGKGHGMLEPVA